MLRIIHCADLHLRRDRLEEGLISIKNLEGHCRQKGAELIVISGDIWDAPIQNTTAFAEAVEAIRGLAKLAPVVMVYGTPSHDVEGSLDVFETLNAGGHTITILRPGKAYYLGALGVSDKFAGDRKRAMLFGVPEPSKKWLLAGQEAIGKEAAEAAVRDSMRALFLGLGGLRKQHPDLPCVLLYHGQVAGATTGTGYSASSGIAVTRDDLAAVGADYYALGDIHEPQQIPGLPAYYPGSAYPLNWGETHQAGFNYVTIDPNDGNTLFDSTPFTAKVERVDFPHPQKAKIAVSAGLSWDASPCKGLVAWVEITATKEEAATVDVESVLSGILTLGALPGSRVTLNVLPTETIRAGEITEKKTLRDKVQVWAQNSGKEPTEGVFAKADVLQAEAEKRGTMARGGSLRIKRLVLRGAIGIWKNSKRDEVELDFEKYGEGVIALVGENGSGKTTLIENCHPWPCMLTRDGTLKDHFRLRDSFRDITFVDDSTGDEYRALIQINAAVASGTAEYYLYKNGAPMPGINGRKEPYEEAVTELFGSLSLYLKSAFTSQRPSKFSPDFSDATKGQRKDLMAELSGIDYLDEYAAIAKGRADTIDLDIQAKRAEIAAIEKLITEIPEKASRVSLLMETLGTVKAEIEALKAEGLRAKAAADKASADASAQKEIMRTASELAGRIVKLEMEEAALIKTKASLQETLSRRYEYHSAANKYDELKAREEELNAERTRILKDRERITTQHRDDSQALRDEIQKYTNEKTGVEKNLAEIRQEVAVLRQRAEHLRESASTPLEDTCPTCAQKLPQDKIEELKYIRSELLKKAGDVDAERAKKEAQLLKATVNLENLTAKIAAIILPPPPELPGFDDKQIDEVHRHLSVINITTVREALKRADEAAVRIEEGDKRLAAIDEEERTVAEKYTDAKEKIDPELIRASEMAEKALEDKRSQYSRKDTERASLETSISHLEKELSELQKRSADVQKTRQETNEKAQEVSEWRFLQEACGQNGIQALELDALCPGIAAVANDLLRAAYGSRYQLEFSTTRIGGKGSKTKQIEDFLIYILDSETGLQQEISTLSGGESVWIKRAIYDAFAVVRDRNTGVKFLTIFSDEADGALDPASREMYFRMLERAHQEAGRFQTIIISHSREIQAMVSQIINVGELHARNNA